MDTDVVGGRVVFGVIICHVFLPRVPTDVKLVACYLVGNPKIPHFHGA